MKQTIVKHASQLILLCIVIVGILLRFVMLGEIPTALNRDEAALGYTAWSLMHTSRDEHGVLLPVNIQSFGDWKLPVYVYGLIPFISVFGLHEWSVRLLSALSGVFYILMSYLICKNLSAEGEKKHALFFNITLLPLVVALFVAISPWSVHLSRIAYEANLAMALFSGGLLSFLVFIRSSEVTTKKRAKSFYGYTSAILFGLTLFTYHSYQVFTPLFASALIIVFRNDLLKMWKLSKNTIIGPVTVFISLFILLIISQNSGANSTKFSGITIFSEKQYEQTLFENRELTATAPTIASKLYISMPKLIADRVATNIMNIVSPQFLFIQGGSHGSHNFPGVGNMFWFSFLTVPLGIFIAVSLRTRFHTILLLWVLLAMVAPIITIESAHSIRFSPALIPLEMLSAIGLVAILQWSYSKSRVLGGIVTSIWAVLIAYSLYILVISYFIVFPSLGIKNWPDHPKLLADFVLNPAVRQNKILIDDVESSPYIWILFYYPEHFKLDDIEYYEPSDEGFVHAKRLSNIHFGKIDWQKEASASAQTLYIAKPRSFVDQNLSGLQMQQSTIIQSKNSDSSLVVIEKL